MAERLREERQSSRQEKGEGAHVVVKQQQKQCVLFFFSFFFFFFFSFVCVCMCGCTKGRCVRQGRGSGGVCKTREGEGVVC